MVPGGTFNRNNDPAYPATVSDLSLDRFEVTVGRFRRFVEVYPGSKPVAGAGMHPSIASSGWDAGWDDNLPLDAAALKEWAKCYAERQPWTDEAGNNERLPMNCLTWYVAFAFCAWDGGRLPTEAEWNYAAAAGDEQRAHPWSASADSTTLDNSYAVYACTGDGSAAGECNFGDILPVGSRSPKGDGKWGQADLAGSMFEWILDWYAELRTECDNCANLTLASERVVRGGSFGSDPVYLLSSIRYSQNPTERSANVGIRCARTP
ncbi:formylglycine-generating enzyme family protein [Sorangium sp. So ce394]|uniref:formylglycine-generating enzyme family protein n=1 Tax=Sorangium sp. So ce394 TaxID=3133310 RepID=UPI003F5C893F